MKSAWLMAAAALCLASGPVFAQTTDSEAIEFSKPASGERSAGWTRSQMEAAKQAELPSVNPESVRAAFRKMRAGHAPGEAGSTPEKDLAPAGGERMSGNVRNRPLYWAGRLFFTEPDGDYVCSAQFIDKNIVLTAAHCVRDPDTGNWYENIVFALQYENGKYSQVYKTRCFATLKGWVTQDDTKWPYDYATLLVDGDSKTGYFGTQWNWLGLYGDATKIGYPSSMEGGEVIQIEKGPIAVQDGIVQMQYGNPADQGGSSGGAWIGGFTDASGNEGNHVISLQSFHFEDETGIGYGPYLTDAFRKLWLFTANGCQ